MSKLIDACSNIAISQIEEALNLQPNEVADLLNQHGDAAFDRICFSKNGTPESRAQAATLLIEAAKSCGDPLTLTRILDSILFTHFSTIIQNASVENAPLMRVLLDAGALYKDKAGISLTVKWLYEQNLLSQTLN